MYQLELLPAGVHASFHTLATTFLIRFLIIIMMIMMSSEMTKFVSTIKAYLCEITIFVDSQGMGTGGQVEHVWGSSSTRARTKSNHGNLKCIILKWDDLLLMLTIYSSNHDRPKQLSMFCLMMRDPLLLSFVSGQEDLKKSTNRGNLNFLKVPQTKRWEFTQKWIFKLSFFLFRKYFPGHIHL